MAPLHPLLESQLQSLGLTASSIARNSEMWGSILEKVSQTYTELEATESELRRAKNDLQRKTQHLEQISQLFQAVVEHVEQSCRRGPPGPQLLDHLEIVQAEFERLNRHYSSSDR